MEKLSNLVQNAYTKLAFRLDTTRIIFDKPKFDYQPLPWVGIKDASLRGVETFNRWQAIIKYIPKSAKTVKDIGCCVGFFCHSAVESGLYAVGIDNNERFLRIARYVQSKLGNGENEVFINISISPDNVSIVPRTDVTILLSIWHHWVFSFGLERATLMLQEVWASTNMALVFESGEEEVAEEFNLPFEGVASDWLETYLKKALSQSEIVRLGTFEAASYPHYKIKNHRRTVFIVKKT